MSSKKLIEIAGAISASIMYDKIRKKYSFAANKNLNVCNSSLFKNGCKELMKLFLSLIFVHFSFLSFSQAQEISTSRLTQGMSLEDFILEIQAQTDFTFVYNPEIIEGIAITIPSEERVSLQEILGMVLSPLGFTFILYRDKIILKKMDGPIPMLQLKASNKIEAARLVRMGKMVVGRILCDEDSQPIVGASIRVKNEFKGTASDKDGYYSIKCFVGDTIVVSAIGFVPSENIVGLKMIEDIRLNTNVINLQEVNIVGYGEEAKEEKTGAISTLSASMTGEIPNDFDEILAGTASGLWMQKNSGVPGGASTIAIRGVTSLQPDANSPLIVVDGVPLFNTEESLNQINILSSSGIPLLGLADNYVFNDLRESNYFQKNGLNMINTEDIESISVLKDAYSTSIYGSRGAAGVILITTKQPRKFGLKVNLLMETGVSKPVGKPNLMNGEEYAQFYSNYYSQLKKREVIFPASTNTNWYDKVVRNAKSNKLAFSIQNKKHNGYLYFSFSHLNQEAYIKGADFKRYTGRFNFKQNINKYLKLGANISMTSEKNNSLLAPKIYRDAILKAPNISVYDERGDFNFSTGNNPYGIYTENPVAMALNDKGEALDNYVISNIYADVKLTDWLSYKLDLGINFIETDAFASYRNSDSPDKKITIETDGYSRKFVIANMVRGHKLFGDHSFKFVLGQSFEESRQKEKELNYESAYQITNRNAYNLVDYSSGRRKYALASWFGRVNYNYKQKLFAGLSYRVDGSSRFSNDNRYQIFPAFSAGWIAVNQSDEEFINHLKLRASFGYSGVEQSTYTYGALRTYETHQNDLTYGKKTIYTEANGSNLNLSWEKTENFDFGLDFSLLKNKVNASLDYYSKKVNNLLLFTDVPEVTGYTQQWINVGAMKNTGVELTLDSRLINSTFKWDLFLTAAFNRNEVLELNQAGYEVWGQDQAYKYFKEGREAAQFYLYDWAGVNPTNGNPLWKYADGSLRETPPTNMENRKTFGSGMPKYSGGISNVFSFKGVELSTYFVFAEGKKLMNGTSAILHTYTTTEVYNLSKDVANYWRENGDVTNQPALFNPSITSQNNYTTSRTSSRFFENASFLRMKKLVLAYHLPKKFVNNLKLEGMKVYAQATNLFTITGYSGADPEVSAFGPSSLLSGYDEVTMPQAKTFSLGLRVSL